MSKPHINVTPLIDVLLVLLIIFMVVTPMKPSAFEAKIPSEPDRTRPVGPHPYTLVVTIEQDLSLRLNTRQTNATVSDPAALVDELQLVFELRQRNLAFAENAIQTSPRIERTVFIKAPRSLDYGSVARVIDAVKLAGADPVSLQIDGLE